MGAAYLGIAKRSRKKAEFYGGSISWIKTLDLNENIVIDSEEKITEAGFKSIRGKIRPINTVMVAMYGGKGTVGKSGILGIPATTNQAVCCIEPNPNNFDSFYLLYYLIYFRPIWMRYAIGTRKDPNISKGIIEKTEIPFPPLPEQKTIAHNLRTIQKAKETRQRELELERERKAALMQYFFTRGTCNQPREETKVGEIPNSWKVIKFGQICESSAYGPRFSGNLYDPNGTIATLRTTDIDEDGNINYSTMPFASLEIPKFKNHLIEVKDLVITRSGTCGIAAVFESYNSPVIPGAFLIRFRLNEHAEPYFLRYYINSHIGRKRITQLASGAVQKNISGTSLLNWLIPLPTIPEQLKIVGILRTCDRKIQALEKEIALIDELFHAMLEQLMTGKISTQPLTETYV